VLSIYWEDENFQLGVPDIKGIFQIKKENFQGRLVISLLRHEKTIREITEDAIKDSEVFPET